MVSVAASRCCGPSPTSPRRTGSVNWCLRRSPSTRNRRRSRRTREFRSTDAGCRPRGGIRPQAPARRSAMSEDRLLTVVEAAGYLGIRPWTLRHWICDRKIEIVKYGNGIVRIRQSVVEQYLANCTIKAKGSYGRPKESRLLEGSRVDAREKSLAG